MKYSALTLIFFLFWANISAQTLPIDQDSLIELGKQLYVNKKFLESDNVFDTLTRQIREKKSTYDLAKLYHKLGVFYHKNRNRTKALSSLFLGIETLSKKNINSSHKEYFILYDSTENNWGKGYPTKKSRDLAAIVLSDLYIKIGGVFFNQKEYKKAKIYWEKTLWISKASNNLKGLSSALINLGEIKRLNDQNSAALSFYFKAIKIKKSIKDTFSTCISYSNIAITYLKLGKVDSAKLYYLKADELASKVNSNILLLNSFYNYGCYYMEINNPDKAIQAFRQASYYAVQINDMNFLLDVAQNLSKLYEGRNKLDSALFFQKQMFSLNEELKKQENEQLAFETEAKYMINEKEKELIYIKEKANIEANNTVLRNRIQKGLIAGLFIILIFTAFILRLRNKHSKKLKGHLLKIQEKNDEKDMLLKEIHHRVKNNLQVITGLLSLQTVNIDDPKIKELFGYSQMRIQSMALIHEMLYQSKSISTINYQNYIKELINSLILSFKGNEHKIKTHLSVPPINLNIDTAITLGLIINEIITNALKYGIPGSNSGNLSVEMIENKLNNYTLKIGDDGIGFSDGFDYRKSNSLGLKLIHKLTKQLNGEIVIDKYKKGANYILTFDQIPPTSTIS